MKTLLARLKELRRYPSAVVGLFIIGILLIVSIYAVIAIPYPRAISLWKATGDEWLENPRLARPKWVNFLPGVNQPETVVVRTGQQGTKVVGADGKFTITLPFKYTYNGFPPEVTLFLTTKFRSYGPYVEMFWVTPEGEKIPLRKESLRADYRYLLGADPTLRDYLGCSPLIGLFTTPPQRKTPTEAKPRQGNYQVVIEGYVFEEGSDFDAKLVVYGRVHGWAGTDHLRRDLTLPLLWGTPIAFVFGLVAAVGISVAQFTLGAVSAWYGRSVDASLQFVTRVWMVLPALPIYIMVGMFFSKSIWAILMVVLILGMFGGGVLNARSMFIQAKEAPYIEAARAYGAKNRRIIFRYLIPRVLPVLIPGFVNAIPGYVFLEASLSFLGLGDPSLPTWGKVLNESNIEALLQGHYHWVVQPALLLMVTGFAFALVGFALDRIFNPRLRTI